VATAAAGTVEMPYVVGMRHAEASVVLGAAELRVASNGGSGTIDPDSLVVAQQPDPGQLVEIGSVARLTLGASVETTGDSKGPRWVVCIDAGHQAHGDSTPEPIGPGSKNVKPRVSGGATGVTTGIPESEIALQIATNLQSQLEGRGIKVIMVRTTNDVNLGNASRAKIANRAKADLFVRIHADGSPEAATSGVSTLYPASNRWTKRIVARSRRAARSVQDALVASTGAVDHGIVKRADIAGFNWSRVPVILVETGFLSNSVEDRLLASPHYQDKVAVGIADGITAYLEGVEGR
jgi:N-acetylmuramoyl-L-alanine amidase